MSPLATPLLMMSPLRSGRYRLPIAPTSSRPRTSTTIRPRTAGGRSGSSPIMRRLRGGRSRSPALGRSASALGAPCARGLGSPGGRPGGPRARRRSAGRAGLEQALATLLVDVVGRPRRPASVGWTRTTRRSSRRRAALDEAALLHPVDDPGRARDRDVERLREPAHRQRPVRLEDRQDVEVDEAERALQPRAEHAASARAGSTRSSRRRSAWTHRGSRRPIIQCHVDNLRQIDHAVKDDRRAAGVAGAALPAEPASRSG